MLVIKDVKVHGDTHAVLKLIKTQNRNKSMDEVIRELVKKGTGRSVEQYSQQKKNAKLTSFLK
jgi:predicted CopG family antitoxin